MVYLKWNLSDSTLILLSYSGIHCLLLRKARWAECFQSRPIVLLPQDQLCYRQVHDFLPCRSCHDGDITFQLHRLVLPLFQRQLVQSIPK